MIIYIDYKKSDMNKGAEPGMEDMWQLAEIISADKIRQLESKDSWGFVALDVHDNCKGRYIFPLSDGIVAYVMENGKTVQRMPRN